MNPWELSFSEVRTRMASRELSSRELVSSVFDRIESVEPRVHAYLSLRDRSDALTEALRVDERRYGGEELGPLAGVPIAVKDNIATRDLPTTAGSRILEGFVSLFDATAVLRARQAGAIVLGKTNLDEFGMGSSNENSAFSVTRNPWRLDRVPGGSSGGSAAAVAAGEAILALGSDTGGSVRQPAGFCGVVGAKPTYGRVSRYGLVAFASSLDQIGPISSDVEGAAALLHAIAGIDARDATTAGDPVPDYTASLSHADLAGLVLGLPEEHFVEGLDPAVETRVRAAAALMKDLGASVVDVSIPHAQYGIAAYYVLANAEASSNLARYDGVKYGRRAPDALDLDDLYARTRSEGFGPEVKRRIMLGTYVLSSGYMDRYYGTAQKVRAVIASEFARAFEDVDAIIAPTSPTAAFALGERIDDPLAMYLSDAYTVPANLAGISAVSVPCGLSDEGLPVGMQIMADRFREPTMFRIASVYERAARIPRGPQAL